MNLTTYTVRDIKQKAKEFDIPLRVALFSRKRSLMSWLKTKEVAFMKIDPLDFVPLYCSHDDICKARREIAKINKELFIIDNPATDEITPDMIQRAKDYPIEKLIDFSKGNSLAWCHDDKSPSLNWYKKSNRAHCFPCGKSFDSIAVLMDRDKFTFHEAIRRLQ